MGDKLSYSTLEKILWRYCHETREDIGKPSDYHKISVSRFDADYLLAPAMTDEQQVNLLYKKELTDPNIRSEIDGGRVITRNKATLARYRNGQEPLSQEIIGCFKRNKDDLVDCFDDVFYDHIIAGLSDADQDRLINEIVAIIQSESENGTMLARRKVHFLNLAKRETASLFLAEVYVYSVIRYIGGFDEFDGSEFEGIKHLIYNPITDARPTTRGIYNAPYDANDDWIELSDELAQLRRGFQRGNYMQSITGERGVGKTELAYRFACDAALDKRKTVIWLDACDETSLYLSMRHFLLEKNIKPDALNKNTTFDKVVWRRFIQWTINADNWLIVLDDYNESDKTIGRLLEELPKPSEKRWILSTSGVITPPKNGLLLRERAEDSQILSYLQRRYGGEYQITPFNAEDILLFGGVSFALELSSGYAKQTKDFEQDRIASLFMKQAEKHHESPTYVEYDSEGNPIENFIDHVSYVLNPRDINASFTNMLSEDIIRMAFDLAWSCLDEHEKYIMHLLARMPNGEIDAYMLEEVFYGDAGYDFFISTFPKDVWRFVLNSELFVETIGQIASMGICKISFYDQQDSRWQNHFKGLRKLRMYQMVRDYINEQPDLTKSQQIAFTSIVQKMTDLQ